MEDFSAVNMKFDRSLNTMIIHDQDDKVIPAKNSHDLNDQLTQSELVLTKGLGHRGVLYDQEVLSNISNFLNKKVPARMTVNTS